MSTLSTKLEIFRRMCLTRYFELRVIEAYKKGLITCPVYLSIGQESISAAISTVIKDYYILAQHRAHSVYLSFGGNPARLIDELLGLPTGCSGGMGGSPSIQDSSIKMIGHHGLIGENVPLAVGVAMTDKVVCFFGDGAAEEDYVFGAMGFAVTHKLPILFVCEDNDLSVLTHKDVRRNWEMANITTALGMPSIDTTDDPWLIADYTKELIADLPAFINCRTCRHHWHVGIGVDSPPEWDRFALVKEQLGLRVDKIKAETKQYVGDLWNERLRIQSEN